MTRRNHHPLNGFDDHGGSLCERCKDNEAAAMIGRQVLEYIRRKNATPIQSYLQERMGQCFPYVEPEIIATLRHIFVAQNGN